MMNTDGTTGGNNMGLGQTDDQQMITPNDRENYIGRLTHHFNGNRDLAKQFDDQAISRSGGKAVIYRKVLQMLLQQRTQQIQQMQQQQQQQQSMMTPQQQQQQSMMTPQQQQQQSMMTPQQQQQQTMYMQSQQPTMVGMPQQQQQQPPPTYTMQAPLSSSIAPPTPMMNIKQELMAPPTPMMNIKQELMAPPTPIMNIKQELMVPPIPQQQTGVPIQQMRQQQQQQPLQYNQQQQPLQYNQQQQQQPLQYNQQQPQSLPNQPAVTTPQQRNIVQQLQQVRQQNYLNQQQQQQESSNSIQLQQQQQPSNPSTVPQSSSSTSNSTTSAGSSDEILQQLLTSPNPPKQPSTVAQNAAQVRLRTINRNVRNPAPQILSQQQQQQPSPMTPGSDPMMTGNIPSPHSHPGMMQQPQTPIGPPGQSPLARYMMAQSPQAGIYRPQMSPMNMMNYAGSPTTMIDDEMHYLFKYFTERIHYLTRIITRCQQEGQHDKVAKYRQLHDQMAAFVRNPIPEHLMAARRLKEHVDRIIDPRMFGPVMMPPMVDMTGMIPANNNGNRLMTNGMFEQCQRAIVDYLNKDSTLKYNVAKRFLEPLSEVLNGVPHKNMRLDAESKQLVEPYSSLPNSQLLTSLVHIIESEFSLLSMNTFTYELKPLSDKMSTSTIDVKDLPIRDYELTCRFIEINMPVVPPLKMKLTIKYPNEPPEVLSLTSTTLSLTSAKLENSDGHSFFESISRNFIYFLFKLPAQHTVTDILDIWRTAIQNASLIQRES